MSYLERKPILTQEEKDNHFQCCFCGEFSEIDMEHEYIKINKQLKETQEKLNVAVEALEFYGDTGKWGKSNQNHFNGVGLSDCDIIKNHHYQGVWYCNSEVGGKRARQALTKIKGE